MPSKVSSVDASTVPVEGETMANSRLLRYSFVRTILEENEKMLHEIDELRDMVARQNEQLIADEKRIRFLEAQLATGSDSNSVEELYADFVGVDKTSILRSILGAILTCQFGDCYARVCARSRRIPQDAEISFTIAESTSNTSSADADVVIVAAKKQEERDRMFELALRESNRRLDEACHLLQSYQDTPSFSATPYDQLMIEVMMHVIGLSKMMNAMVMENFNSPTAMTQWLINVRKPQISDIESDMTPLLPSDPPQD
ncbi:uncharacterized protein TM35_000071460 [Trypanosoma theileri]|uniref:Uncharacterized protein n=1 Tax=Trypanosoma theileri TaxID=67003 RepID=A0A1X0P1C7_9TRYP|nr:uncharacterized protein TM35_000071460 [Trypanosoma theileri]ORC90722.1 hypothetical protein TM35_000071460 [Trypanosoma theileri]